MINAARTGRHARWLVVTALVLLGYGCSSSSVKLSPKYTGNTPPADIQSARVAVVHVAARFPDQSLEDVGSDFRGETRYPWGAQVKGILEDSLEKMQIDRVLLDAGYRGSTDLPALLELAREEKARYLLLMESDIVVESDNSLFLPSGSWSFAIEVLNTVSIYWVDSGERLLFHSYRRKLNSDSELPAQFSVNMASRLINQNLHQFWEDVAFELRESEIKAQEVDTEELLPASEPTG